MTLNDIREKYLAFYKARGHAIVPSSLLVPRTTDDAFYGQRHAADGAVSSRRAASGGTR